MWAAISSLDFNVATADVASSQSIDFSPSNATSYTRLRQLVRYAQSKLRRKKSTYPIDFSKLRLLVMTLIVMALRVSASYFPSISNYGNCPPWEAMCGEKVDFKRRLQCHPGELVEERTYSIHAVTTYAYLSLNTLIYRVYIVIHTHSHFNSTSLEGRV